MRTERPADSGAVQRVEQITSIERNLPVEVKTYVASALRLELLALDLANRNVDEAAAVRALIEAAKGDVRVMRRAHRHCELAMSDQWPAGRTLIRAFDYLCGGRRELETKRSHGSEVVLQPSTMPANKGQGELRTEYDLVDEASMESFPASDAPSFWGR